jgi:hypothetical protein
LFLLKEHRWLVCPDRLCRAFLERQAAVLFFIWGTIPQKGGKIVKVTYKKGLVRLAIFMSVFGSGWALIDYFVCRLIMIVIVVGWVIYWLIGGFFDID